MIYIYIALILARSINCYGVGTVPNVPTTNIHKDSEGLTNIDRVACIAGDDTPFLISTLQPPKPSVLRP